jgi:hypothetical protein
MKQYKRVLQEDITLNRIQDSVEDFAQAIIFPAITGINIVKSVVLTTADKNVNHLLNRPFKGYLVINRNADSTIYTSTTTNNRTDLFIILKASATVTVDLMFF